MCIRDSCKIPSCSGPQVHLSLDDNWTWGPEQDGILPVSYTHLDVYKRQGMHVVLVNLSVNE